MLFISHLRRRQWRLCCSRCSSSSSSSSGRPRSRALKCGNSFTTYLGRHEGERIDATEQSDADGDDEHDSGERQNDGEKGHQPEVRPARRSHGEGQLQWKKEQGQGRVRLIANSSPAIGRDFALRTYSNRSFESCDSKCRKPSTENHDTQRITSFRYWTLTTPKTKMNL